MDSRINNLSFQFDLNLNTLIVAICWVAAATLVALDFFEVTERPVRGIGILFIGIAIARHQAGLAARLAAREIEAYELGRKTVRAVPHR